MLKSNLKIFVENLFRYRLYSAINILGLAIGIASCLLISLFVLHETSYDEYHAKAERLYRISRNFETGRYAYNAAPAGPMLQEQFPGIEAYARVTTRRLRLIRQGEGVNDEPGIRFADNSLFSLFDFAWREGDPANALQTPGSIVVTEALAAKYFPEGNAMGNTLEADGLPLRVTGIIGDLPDDTHLDFRALVSWDTQARYDGGSAYEEWSSTTVHTYVLLRQGADIREISSQLPEFVAEFVPPWRGDPTSMEAIKVTGIHLHGALREFKPLRDPGLLLILAGIAASVLVIACVNFMNLSTARGSLRAKEIGVRKSIGATRAQLVVQFLTESLFTTALAMVAAIALAEALLPAFNAFVGLELALPYSGNAVALLALIGGGALVGVMAGAWPAFFLSAFSTVKVLKGDYSRGSGGLRIRNGLVVLQFAAAIMLIACTVVMVLQMRLARESYAFLGMGSVVQVGVPEQERRELFKQQLLAHPAITEVAGTDRGPFGAYRTVQFMSSADDPQLSAQVFPWYIDHDFLEFLDIPMLAGRRFIEGSASDLYEAPTDENPLTHAGFILNESAARAMGWTPEEALGENIRWEHRRPAGAVPATLPVEGPVVGVVADVVYESIDQEVKPQLLMYWPERAATFQVRARSGAMAAALAHIDETWAALWPERPLNRRLLTSIFEAAYRSYLRQGELISCFAAIAVILACFGLFGLAAFNAERRIKEIGVRKVMGGSVWSILVLLTNDFSKLVLIANVIAWPIAWAAMDRWLEDFAYRIDLTPMLFIGSGLIALCVAWVTVGGTAAKAASAKPVLALRYE